MTDKQARTATIQNLQLAARNNAKKSEEISIEFAGDVASVSIAYSLLAISLQLEEQHEMLEDSLYQIMSSLDELDTDAMNTNEILRDIHSAMGGSL